eukprot:7390711-Prymnesium_polylepis.2
MHWHGPRLEDARHLHSWSKEQSLRLITCMCSAAACFVVLVFGGSRGFWWLAWLACPERSGSQQP